MKKRVSMLKRLLSCTLVTVLAAGLVACGSTSADTSGQTAASAESVQEDTEVTAAESAGSEAAAGTETAKPGEITIWFCNEGSNYEKVFDRFEELTKDTLNTKINLNWTTNHAQEMPLKLMNQEPCDLTFDAYWINMAKNIQDGLYADLSSYFNNPEYPGLQKAFTGDLLDSMYDSEGHIYAIPLLETYNDSKCFFIRGDWREKYDLPEVTDEETLRLYLDTMEEHKEELGLETPVGLGNRGYFYFKYDVYTKIANNICEIDSTGARVTQQFEVLLSDDGKTVLDANVLGDPDERFADYPEGYQSNYRTAAAIELGDDWGKYVNEDFVTATDINVRWNNGKFAMIEGNLSGYVSTVNALQQVDPNAKVECYFYEPQVQNMEKTFSNQSFANNYMVVPYYSENIDRTMKFLDWIFASQENNDLFHYGIEGEDYELNEDGTITILSPDNMYSFPGYELCWNPMYYHPNSSLGEYLEYDQWSRDQDNFQAHPLLGFIFNPNETTELSTSLAAYKALQENYYHHFMAGKYGTDTEAKIQEFYEQAEPDVEVIREALMRQVQAYLDAKN